MIRSFTDRVLGGVCGGLSAALPVNAWVLRGLFVALTLLSLGAFAALYLLLWWLAPQESLLRPNTRGLPLVIVLLLTLLVAAAWAGRWFGLLRGPTGLDIAYPALLLLLSLVLVARQLRPRPAARSAGGQD